MTPTSAETATAAEASIPVAAVTGLLISSAIQAYEWLEGLRKEYTTCPYFEDVLVALGCKVPPENDTAEKTRQRHKRAKQYSLEEGGLIR